MKTTEELVRELVDREAIRDLSVRYCDCLRRKDVAGLLALFTDDATFVIRGTEVEAASHGRAEIRTMHEKAVAQTNPRLFVHTQIVDLLAVDRATGRCSVEVRNVVINMERLGLGYFEDEYAKVGDQWKFTSCHQSFDGLDNKLDLRTSIAQVPSRPFKTCPHTPIRSVLLGPCGYIRPHSGYLRMSRSKTRLRELVLCHR